MTNHTREASVFEQIFGPMPEIPIDYVRRKAIREGYQAGFNAARDKIASVFEEEGKSQTAARIRKMSLSLKESR